MTGVLLYVLLMLTLTLGLVVPGVLVWYGFGLLWSVLHEDEDRP